MRGKPCSERERGCTDGITPAHAGKTPAFTLAAAGVRDHPRACGENKPIMMRVTSLAGSPPRMRGKRDLAESESDKGGITPAHAGKTRTTPLLVRKAGDHPRACGENSRLPRVSFVVLGSPPRMRGKRRRTGVSRAWPGITPAHAGKTSCGTERHLCSGDHPRACGENPFLAASSNGISGSPPRMRGKPTTTRQGSRPRGITPAHAGKT